MVKNLPTVQETWVQFLAQEDPLGKEMATHSSILAWRIPWTEEPGGLQSMGWERVRHDWATNTDRWSLPLASCVTSGTCLHLSELWVMIVPILKAGVRLETMNERVWQGAWHILSAQCRLTLGAAGILIIFLGCRGVIIVRKQDTTLIFFKTNITHSEMHAF